MKDKLLKTLKTGHENALSLTYLSSVLLLDERQVRRLIADINEQYDDIFICNLQDGLGYFKPKDRAELEEYFNQENARLISQAKKINPMKTYLRSIEGQRSISQ